MQEPRSLNEEQLDAIKEVGNIGAGHAATALSQLIGQKTMITIPKVMCFPIEKTVDMVGGPQMLVAGVLMHVLGDVSAKIVLILPRSSALQLAGLLTKQQTEEKQIITMLEHSAIKEVGNILAGAYLNALNELLGLLLLQSVPQLIFDMAEAVVAEIAKGFPAGTEIISIETEFMESNRVIQGYFFLIPEKTSLDVILRATKLTR